MEIKLNAGDKITIPTGCKATIEDDLIVIEEKQEEFKDGDILITRDEGLITIFKSYEGNNISFCSYFNNENTHDSNWACRFFRHATEEEKQAFFDELEAKGLHWNAETKTMEKIRKRAKLGEYYLYIDRDCTIIECKERAIIFDGKNYKLGNYYLPSEIAKAKEDAKAIKAIFEKRLKM